MLIPDDILYISIIISTTSTLCISFNITILPIYGRYIDTFISNCLCLSGEIEDDIMAAASELSVSTLSNMA